MPRAKIPLSQQMRTTQQLATASAGMAIAETNRVAAQADDLVTLTLGLDVDGTRQSIATINRRLDELENI